MYAHFLYAPIHIHALPVSMITVVFAHQVTNAHSFCDILHGGSDGMSDHEGDGEGEGPGVPVAVPAAESVTTSIAFQPPEKFDFKNPDGWPKWKWRFQQFLSASGLEAKDEARKVSTLLYTLGDEAEEVLASTSITQEERITFRLVMEKLDQFFQVRKNILFERARFNRRDQEEGESAETYITELYRLVETCDYGGMKEEMLRDRLVVGIRDTRLSEKLQMDANLTLETAKKNIRQKEAVHQQSRTLQASSKAEGANTLNEVSKRRWHTHQRQKGGQSAKPKANKGGASVPRTGPRCIRCGKGRHPTPEQCPAREAICNKCHRKGHYAAQCLSKTVAATHEVQAGGGADAAFLGAVSASKDIAWVLTIRVNDTDVTFKLDTGAEVTVISEETFSKLKNVKLRSPSRRLYGPAQQPLNVLGEFSGNLEYQRKTTTQSIFVAKNLQNDLAGLPAITALGLIRAVEATSSEKTIQEQFPDVFKGLGTIGGEYTIKLRDGATPHALYTPRRVPFPLREKVRQELEKMEEMGVISKVTSPTPWCAGMVVVRKKSGAVRICVDLKPLNESVKREVHPIPRVDETLAQLTGAKIFSKLDANSGYWQIPLAEESRLLTTFVTPFGRYCFHKLPFGISSAPELFQRRMNVILDGLDGRVCQIDDVLVFGKDEAEHDARLRQVLERIQEKGVTLNAE